MTADPENACDMGGRCDAGFEPSSQTANCIDCGKELHWRDGHWWTWDAHFMPQQQPQHGSKPKESTHA